MAEENKSPAEEPVEPEGAGSEETAPAPQEEAKAAEAPAPQEEAKPAEAPAPQEEAKAAEAPAPQEEAKAAEAPAESGDAAKGASTPPARESRGRPGGRFGGGPGGRGGRGGRRGGRGDEEDSRYAEVVVKINRCSKVIKGGRRFSFSALVVLGDKEGNVGIGFGKANEVPLSVEKAMKIARNAFTKVSIHGNTIPHKIVGSYRSSRVVMIPATEGTGIIAGAPVRAVVECAGVKDLLTKVHGSTNPLNVVKATLNGLKQLRTREEVSMLRGVEIPE